MTDANPYQPDIIADLLKAKKLVEDASKNIPIAIALTPSFWDTVKRHGIVLRSSDGMGLPMGVPMYIWKNLPVPFKAFASQKEFEQWKEQFGD